MDGVQSHILARIFAKPVLPDAPGAVPVGYMASRTQAGMTGVSRRVLQDCGGSYAGNRVSGNRKGSMALDAAILELDAEQLQRDNQLDRAVTFA